MYVCVVPCTGSGHRQTYKPTDRQFSGPWTNRSVNYNAIPSRLYDKQEVQKSYKGVKQRPYRSMDFCGWPLRHGNS